MKIYYIQHVPFEGIAYIGKWSRDNDLSLKKIAIYENGPIPSIEDCDALIIMGGPMGANDEKMFPWLKIEKQFIAKAIENDKIVMGICLGAQLIASVMGAGVFKNAHKEIGWFPVQKTPRARNSPVGKILPDRFTAFHWHGDTFDIPPGAVHLAESEACKNQAFVYQDRVVALQFHLESTRTSIDALIEHCGNELVPAPFIQTADQIRQGCRQIEESNTIMARLMDHLINLDNP